MDWLQVCIYTTAAGIEPVSGALLDAGVTGMEIEDEADFLDFLENNKQYWDYVDDELMQQKKGETCVKVYVADNAAGGDMLSAIRSGLAQLKARDTANEFGRLELSLTGMNEEDWANNWKQYYKPTEVGKRILIRPEWEDIGPTDRVVFTINPGMSFGTGTHHSTQLCIESLEDAVQPGHAILDLGCGSGILSVIALLLGASDALAVDIDPNAADIAIQNAAKNGFGPDRYRALAGDVLSDSALRDTIGARKYDVVLANIVADVIIPLAGFVPAVMAPGGTFITSGIIDTRLDEVKDALTAAGLHITHVRQRDCWACVTCTYGVS